MELSLGPIASTPVSAIPDPPPSTTTPSFDWWVPPLGPDRTPPAVVGYET